MELRDLISQRIQTLNENIDKCLSDSAFFRDDGNDALRDSRAYCAEMYRIRVSELEWILSKL